MQMRIVGAIKTNHGDILTQLSQRLNSKLIVYHYKLNKNEKYHPTTLKIVNEVVKMIKMGKHIWHK